MYHPERRTQQRDTLNEDAFALIQIDELRTHTFTFHVALFDGHASFSHIKELRSANLLGFRDIFIPTESIFSAHLPPCVSAAVSINGSFTRDGDIFGLISIDARLVIHAV